MKLITRPKTITPDINSLFINKSRKQVAIVGSENNKSTPRALIYSKIAKKTISEVPGLVKSIYDLSHNKEGNLKIRLRGKTKQNKSYICSIIKQNACYEDMLDNVLIDDYHYLIEFKCDGKTKKYFGKQSNDYQVHSDGRDGFNEMLGLDYLRKQGLNIVEPYFGFTNGVDKKSFIFYEYMDPKEYLPVDKALYNDKISSKNYNLIESLVSGIDAKLSEKHFNHNGVEFYFSDIVPRNVFINRKTGKLYLYDPWFSTMKLKNRRG